MEAISDLSQFFPEEQGTGLFPDEVFRLLLLAAARVSVSVDRVKLGLLTSLRAMEDTFVRIPSSVMLEGRERPGCSRRAWGCF